MQPKMQHNRKPPKYRNQRVDLDGFTFDSKREAARYAELKMLQKAGLIRDLELQPRFSVSIGGRHYCSYKADFRYFDVKAGCSIVEDVKSPATAKERSYRLRKKAAELEHGIVVREVF